MPIVQVGSKWEVNGETFDTEEKAEAAYAATIALQFGVKPEKKDKKKKKKK